MTARPAAQRHRRCQQAPCNWCRAWADDEKDRLRVLAGTMPLPELVDQMNAEFAHVRLPRSRHGIMIMASRLGVLVEYTEGLTMRDLEHIVGWNDVAIVRHWVTPGLLPGRKVRGRGTVDGRWQFLEADLRRFIEDHPEAYDWQRFAPGPWRRLAEVAARRSPWRTKQQLLDYLGLQWPNWWEKRWRTIPHVRRHHGCPSSVGVALIHQDEFPALRASLDPKRYARRATHVTRRLAA